MALFGGLSVGSGSVFKASAFVLVLGVFSGSALWWLALSTGVNLLRNRLSGGMMRWVNHIAGIVMLTFGVVVLWRALALLLG